MPLQIAQDPAADRVLSDHPFALLAGMLLDQQFPMEHAFRGPAKVLERFGSLEPARIAAADPEEFAALCWEAAVGAYAEPGYRSVADVVDPDSLQKVREFKKQKKAAAKAAG
jgi:3-methyladenine DNA glycosylase/8-oxoguanine DNA glycosylase